MCVCVCVCVIFKNKRIHPCCLYLQECGRPDMRLGRCPGLCPALQDCGSCTVQGQGASIRDTTPARLWQAEKCAWCVKEEQCQTLEGG